MWAWALHRSLTHPQESGSDLYARLRRCVVRPVHEAMYIEVQKLRGELGPVGAYGWLVITRPTGEGAELQAFLTVEVGRGRLLSPLATFWVDLDGKGRYLPEAGTDGPAARVAFPDDPARPGLLLSILEPISARLTPALGTLLAALAVLAEEPPAATVPDARQSAAYRKRSGRHLVPYRRIPRQAGALGRLLGDVGRP